MMSPALRTQAASIARAALTGQRAPALALGFLLLLLAGAIAPGESPGAWTWVRVIVSWLLAVVALVSIDSAPDRLRRGRPVSPLVVWGSLVLAVIVSLTLTTLAAALSVLILVILLSTIQAGETRQPPTFWVAVGGLTPLWVWSAFDAWDRWLLMLIPFGAAGMVSLEHAMRAGRTEASERERLAAWAGVVGVATAALLVGLLAGIPTGWLSAGALGVTALAVLDLLLIYPATRRALPPVALPAAALLWVAWAWLAAL